MLSSDQLLALEVCIFWLLHTAKEFVPSKDSFVIPRVGIHTLFLFFLTSLLRPIVPWLTVLDSGSGPFGRHLYDCRWRRVVTQLVQKPPEVPVMDGVVSS